MAPLKLWLLFFHYTVYPPDLWVSHPRVGGHFCFLRKKKAPKPKINQLNNPNSQAYISLFFLVFLLDSSFLFPLFLFSLSGYRSVLTEVYILSKFVFQPALIFKQEFIGSKKKKKKRLFGWFQGLLEPTPCEYQGTTNCA